MSGFPGLETAHAYLHVSLAPSRPVLRTPSRASFVTISRQAGTGGSAFAAALAKRLTDDTPERPWHVYSGNLIEEMLRSHQLSPRLARFLPEDRIHEFEASVGEFFGLHPNLWDLIAKTNDLIRQIARAEHAILLGRGAVFATAGLPHGVHMRLVASPTDRAARTARRLSISMDDALTENARRDAARERYVRATFNAEIADPGAYHVVLNATALGFQHAVDTIAHLVLHRVAPAPTLTRSEVEAAGTLPAENLSQR